MISNELLEANIAKWEHELSQIGMSQLTKAILTTVADRSLAHSPSFHELQDITSSVRELNEVAISPLHSLSFGEPQAEATSLLRSHMHLPLGIQ